jgi:hypothetical protein
VVRMSLGRARTYARHALTGCSRSTLTRRKRIGLSHLEESKAPECVNDNGGPCDVSGWREWSSAQIAETRASHCSLVVLDDTEARFLWPLLTVQPSSRFRIRSSS